MNSTKFALPSQNENFKCQKRIQGFFFQNWALIIHHLALNTKEESFNTLETFKHKM